jgi:23S rRNA pseudouridine2605 synthase
MRKVPLERALSKRGIASRQQAREWIFAGRVRVDGVVRTHVLFPVEIETAEITVDDAILDVAPVTLMLHKPRGVLTTARDEQERKTVFDLVPGYGHLAPVGRLDLATTGLLLLTNDTDLAGWLTDPANAVPRIYVVTVRGRIAEDVLPDHVELQKASGRESHLVVTLREGRNREIRRLFEGLGHEVTRLKRVSYGPLQLGALAPGEHRIVPAEELRAAFPAAPLRAG